MKKMTKSYKSGGIIGKIKAKRANKKEQAQKAYDAKYSDEIKDIGYKKGGSVNNAKLAAMAAPKNKITRADIITAAKKKAKKK